MSPVCFGNVSFASNSSINNSGCGGLIIKHELNIVNIYLTARPVRIALMMVYICV